MRSIYNFLKQIIRIKNNTTSYKNPQPVSQIADFFGEVYLLLQHNGFAVCDDDAVLVRYDGAQNETVFFRNFFDNRCRAGNRVADAYGSFELQLLRAVNRRTAMHGFRHRRRNDAGRNHAVGNAALKHRFFGDLFVDVHRIEIARNAGEGIYVRFADRLAEGSRIAYLHFIIR